MSEIHDLQSFSATLLKDATKFLTMKSDEQQLLLGLKVGLEKPIVKFGLIRHLLWNSYLHGTVMQTAAVFLPTKYIRDDPC